eukprot:32384_1
MAQQLPVALHDTALLQTAITPLLQVDNYGWDSHLFEDQNQISFCLCVHCNSICRNAAELGCDHAYDEILLYCKDCLQLLIQDNDGKCPINEHLNPSIHSSRATQRQISKSVVICPYSTRYKMLKRAQSIDDNQITDTIGSDQKEGLIPNQADPGCNWKGTLKELIDTHMVECTKANNPLFVSQIRVKELCDKYINLEQKHQDVTQSLQNKVDKLQEALDSSQRALNDRDSSVQMNSNSQANVEAQKQLEIQVIDKEKEIHDLTASFNKEKDELVTQNKQLMKQNSDQRTEIHDLKKRIEIHCRTISDLTTSFQKEKEELVKKYSSSMMQNKQHIDKQKEDITLLKQQLEETQANYTEILVKNEANGRAKYNTNKRQKYVSASKERDKLTKKCTGLVKQNEQLMKENSDYQKQQSKYQKLKKKENSDYASALKENEKLTEKNKRLRQLMVKQDNWRMVMQNKQLMNDYQNEIQDLVLLAHTAETNEHNQALERLRHKHQIEMDQKNAIITGLRTGYAKLDEKCLNLQREDDLNLERIKRLRQDNDECNQQIILLNAENQSQEDLAMQVNEYKQEIHDLKLKMSQSPQQNQLNVQNPLQPSNSI